MKLVRYGAPGREKPGIIGEDGKIRDLSRIVKDIDGAMLASGGLAKIKKANLKRMKPVPGKPRIGACIGNVQNFIAIGLNYSDHAAEAGMPIPKEPIIFMKATTCIQGPNDEVMLPRASVKTDWEVELAVVIGTRARYVPMKDALAHVAGYTLMNDGSVRDYQVRTPQWTLGKNFDRSGALGPEIVTADELPPGARGLALRGRLNGQQMQAASTSGLSTIPAPPPAGVSSTVRCLSVAKSRICTVSSDHAPCSSARPARLTPSGPGNISG